MLAKQETYEILRPESVGANSRRHLGKHWGRHACRRKLVDLDVDLDEAAFEAAFLKFKELCDRVKNVTDDDIRQLVGSNEAAHAGPFILEHLQFTSGTDIVSHATVTMKVYEETVIRSAWAYGPIEAACKAIDQSCGVTGKLLDYTVKAATAGKAPGGEGRVTADGRGR